MGMTLQPLHLNVATAVKGFVMDGGMKVPVTGRIVRMNTPLTNVESGRAVVEARMAEKASPRVKERISNLVMERAVQRITRTTQQARRP